MEHDGDDSATVDPLSSITTAAMASTLTADDGALGRPSPSESSNASGSAALREDSAQHDQIGSRGGSGSPVAAPSPLSRATPPDAASAFANRPGELLCTTAHCA